MTGTRRQLTALMVVALTVGALGVAHAQSVRTTLELQIYDRDLEIPLEGVRVSEVDSGASGITDAEGRVELDLRLSAPRAVLDLFLFGYEPVRTLVTTLDEPVRLPMTIEGILQAEELVIVANRIGRTDDQAGVSIVVERDFIKTSAMIGIIEDVMSTVKLLPGVSYNGGFGSFLSVRGGEPDGLTHVMDGLTILYPYHWGGGVSVFNPHVVESVKLSAGIFPVRYGQATSGLMEVSSRDPVQGTRWEVAQSTSTLEGYGQIEFGRNAGMFIGTRLTNYDLVFALTGDFLEEQGVTFSRVPFIYAGYLRLYGRPRPSTEWYVNGLVASDGLGLAAFFPNLNENNTIRNEFDFRWRNVSTLFGGGLNQLIGDRLQLSAVAGYERVINELDASFTERGTRTYSDRFVTEVNTNPEFAALAPLVNSGGTFTIDQPNGFFNSTELNHIQLRADGDYQLLNGDLLQAGAGVLLPAYSYQSDVEVWVNRVDESSGQTETAPTVFDQAAPANRTITSFAYTNWQWTIVNERAFADIGLRVDHGILLADNFSLNTVPALGPRALFRWTPRVTQPFTEMTFTAGTGVFSKVPFDTNLINENLALDDFELRAPKSLMALAGWEARFVNGYRCKIEGYYKYLYDRFYLNLDNVAGPNGPELVPRVYSDGVGHVGGFDFVLDRRTSRWFDGMLAYSFIYARYLNPTGSPEDGSTSTPRGRWYYPSFHRFHTLNALANIKPTDWLTLTTTVTFSTGTLTPAYDEAVEIVPVRAFDANGDPFVIETYSRNTFYSDTNREGWELPVDLRLSMHGYSRNGRVYREFYIGAEDILAPVIQNLAPPSNETTVDQYTGEVTRAADQGFSFPIVSIGLRLSY